LHGGGVALGFALDRRVRRRLGAARGRIRLLGRVVLRSIAVDHHSTISCCVGQHIGFDAAKIKLSAPD
jgi:hypothetical protein